MTYHDTLAVNNTGLPKFAPASVPTGLTAGGKLIYRRTARAVETCNAIAELAGFGQEACNHAR